MPGTTAAAQTFVMQCSCVHTPQTILFSMQCVGTYPKRKSAPSLRQSNTWFLPWAHLSPCSKRQLDRFIPFCAGFTQTVRPRYVATFVAIVHLCAVHAMRARNFNIRFSVMKYPNTKIVKSHEMCDVIGCKLARRGVGRGVA